MASKVKLPVPFSHELETAYHHLSGEKKVSVENWVAYSKLCRFDPRIAEAWAKRMSDTWREIPANLLREDNIKSPSPATLGVLLEQVQDYLIEKKDKKLFKLWKDNALYKTPRGLNESFLIGVYPFASKRMQNDAQFPLRSFLKWGFSGTEIFVNKAKSHSAITQQTGINAEARKRKLRDFISARKKSRLYRFSLEDYLAYCDHCISRRIAQLDLQSAKNIKPHGQTRARFYVVT